MLVEPLRVCVKTNPTTFCVTYIVISLALGREPAGSNLHRPPPAAWVMKDVRPIGNGSVLRLSRLHLCSADFTNHHFTVLENPWIRMISKGTVGIIEEL